jgi:hypothetical protein
MKLASFDAPQQENAFRDDGCATQRTIVATTRTRPIPHVVERQDHARSPNSGAMMAGAYHKARFAMALFNAVMVSMSLNVIYENAPMACGNVTTAPASPTTSGAIDDETVLMLATSCIAKAILIEESVVRSSLSAATRFVCRESSCAMGTTTVAIAPMRRMSNAELQRVSHHYVSDAPTHDSA